MRRSSTLPAPRARVRRARVDPGPTARQTRILVEKRPVIPHDEGATSQRDIEFDVRAEGGSTVISVAGELDIYSSPPVRTRLLEVIADAAGPVVLDFTKVPFMDSTGLAVIIAARRLADGRDVALLVRASPAVQKVIEVTGLGPYLTLDA